ncbi:MAG: MATE family efflux transporter [Phycisphaerales bacterium]
MTNRDHNNTNGNHQDQDSLDNQDINNPSIDPDQEEMVVVPGVSIPNAPPPVDLSDDGKFRNGRLAGLNLNQAIWVLAWPVVTESFLNSFVGLVDTALSAGLPEGEAATDAIGGASYIMWLIGLIIMALGVGATALISRSVGKGRLGVANSVLGQTFTIAGATGIVVGIMIWLIVPSIATALNMSPLATEYFESYMSIIALGVPAASILFGMIACSRGAGDSMSPLKAMIARNIVNIVVSWGLSGITIFGLTSPLGVDLGIVGIAVGTVAGDIVGAVYITTLARSGRWSIKLKLIRMKPHLITVSRLIKLGIPNFFETFGLWIGNFVIILFVGFLTVQLNSDGLLGAHIIGIRIEAFSFMPGFGMGIAAATLAGQYLGMNRPDLAKRAVFRCTIIASVIMGTIGVAFITIPKQITALLSDQPTHAEIVPQLLIVCGIVQVPFAISIVFRSAMRGAGDVKVVMALTWFATYALRLPIAYLLSGVDIPIPESMGGGFVENPRWLVDTLGITPGLTALWIGLCSEMALRALLFGARFFQGGWLKAKV